jgi:hypothetical protein
MTETSVSLLATSLVSFIPIISPGIKLQDYPFCNLTQNVIRWKLPTGIPWFTKVIRSIRTVHKVKIGKSKMTLPLFYM